jgi:hypothetical protein
LLTAGHAIPWWSQAVAEWLVRGGLVLVVALTVALTLGNSVDRALGVAKRWLLAPTPGLFAAGIGVATLLASAFLARYCFAGRPFTTDEMAQQWHARILLSGHLALPSEPHPEFFNTAPVLDRPSLWYSQYPIGGPAVIALGLALRAVWLVNPILLGIAAWCFSRFASAAFDELTARLTSVLFLLSPMVLIMGASQMNHVPALACATIGLAALVAWDRAENPDTQRLRAVTIGGALGVMATIRPLDAALVAFVVGSFQLVKARAEPARWRSLAVQGLAGAVPVAMLLWANARTTGNPLLFAYDALNGPGHRLGFHLAPNGEMHTPIHGLVLASGYLMRLDRFLLEWPLPSLLFVVVGLLLTHPGKWEFLLIALAAAFLLGYGAYWFDGFFAGPRFLFTALPAFVFFVARAPIALMRALSQPLLRRACALVVPISVAVAWLGPIGVSSAASRIALYHDQRTKLKTDVDAQTERAGVRNALVFVNESWRGRLLARLRVLGVQQFRAEHVLDTVDACALQTALDAEDSLGARAPGNQVDRVLRRAASFGHAARVPGVPADQAISVVPGSAPTATCVREVRSDSAGSMPYALFLALQHVNADARVGGDIVYVRDFGVRDEILRSRFADRHWYRYRPPADLADTSLAFVPYENTAPLAAIRDRAPMPAR